MYACSLGVHSGKYYLCLFFSLKMVQIDNLEIYIAYFKFIELFSIIAYVGIDT